MKSGRRSHEMVGITERLRERESFLFDRLLHRFLSLLTVESAPSALAIGTWLFQDLGHLEGLRLLYKKLDAELSRLHDDPQIEADLESKLVMLVTYHAICTQPGFIEHASRKILHKYLQFAENEQWFDSVDLAFFVQRFAGDESLTRSIHSFMQSKLREWIEKENVKLCSQCIFVLGEKTLPSDGLRFVEIVQHQDWKQIASDEMAWSIIGLQSLCSGAQTEVGLRAHELMAELLHAYVARWEKEVVENKDDLFLAGLFHQRTPPLERDALGEATLTRFGNSSAIEKIIFHKNTISICLKEGAEHPMPLLISLALAVWVLHLLGEDRTLGVTKRDATELRTLLQEAVSLREKRAILIGKLENWTVNIMGLLLVIVVGEGIALYQAGVTIDTNKFQPGTGFFLATAGTFVLVAIGLLSFLKKGTIASIASEVPFIGPIYKQLTRNTNEGR